MNETGAFSEQKVRQQEVLTSLKDLNLLRVLSRSWSTHSFLLCSSSFLFSRFCRQQGETVRCIGGGALQPLCGLSHCHHNVPGEPGDAGWRLWSSAWLAAASARWRQCTDPKNETCIFVNNTGKITRPSNGFTALQNSQDCGSCSLTEDNLWETLTGEFFLLCSEL